MSVTTGGRPQARGFDQRVAAAFAMTSQHEDVRRPHQLFNPFMGDLTQQMYSAAQSRIPVNSPLDG